MPTPTCCPEAYFCPTAGEMECPRHGGFTICCNRTDKHEPQDRGRWHQQSAADERAWLDRWARSEFYGRKTSGAAP